MPDISPFIFCTTNPVLSAVTESFARMAANSRTSHALSAITMLARMKSDLVAALAIAPHVHETNKTNKVVRIIPA
jgi:hypothetical protein